MIILFVHWFITLLFLLIILSQSGRLEDSVPYIPICFATHSAIRVLHTHAGLEGGSTGLTF